MSTTAGQGAKKPVTIVNPARTTPATAWVLKPTEPIEKYYKLGQRLGQPGQFGQAVLAVHLKTGATRAVKIISKARFTRAADIKYHFEQLRAEIEVMQRMNHPNIIKLYEVFESPSDLYLVMECCTGGELFDRIKEHGSYSERDASTVLRQMCEGLKYMHENGVAHCFPQKDTRILTNQGFLYLEQIQHILEHQHADSSSPLLYAAYESDSKSIRYCPGQLVQLDSQPDQLVNFTAPAKSSPSPLTIRATGNHRMFVRSSESGAWLKARADSLLPNALRPAADKFQFLTRAESGLSPSTSPVPLFSRLSLSSSAAVSAFLQFYGLWVSSGLLGPAAVQLHLNNQPAIDLLSAIIPQLALQSHEYSISSVSDGTMFELFCPSWFAEFSALSQSNLADWALNALDAAQIRLILSSLALASGERDVIRTCSASLRDSLLVALLHAGFAASFECEADGSYSLKWADNSDDSLVNPELSRDSAVTTERYNAKLDGSLWCVQVDHPDHLIIAQRAIRADSGLITQAGQPIIVGNCDLKPDNFLFATPLPTSPIKIIDFGMSKFIDRRKGRYFQVICGTPYYCAPEVIQGRYSEHCDLWSLGVVMFVMLFGYPCFYCDEEKYGAETDERIFQLIQQGFQPVTKAGFGAHFPASIPCSDSAKDLIAKLLQSNPAARITAAEALEHPWLTGETASDKPILKNVLTNLKNFQASCKFKAAVLNMMSSSMTEDEIQTLRKTFQDIDENGDGTITKAELKKALEKAGTDVRSEELEAILRMADIDGDGTISFEELLMTCVQKKLNAKEERIYEAFCKLDLNGDGKLSVEELEKVLTQNAQDAKALIAEVDIDGDGTVSYEEFITMWRGKEEAARMTGGQNSLTQKMNNATAQLNQ